MAPGCARGGDQRFAACITSSRERTALGCGKALGATVHIAAGFHRCTRQNDRLYADSLPSLQEEVLREAGVLQSLCRSLPELRLDVSGAKGISNCIRGLARDGGT